MSIEIISKIAPKNGGQFPTHSDQDGYGGFQVRANNTDRDSIPTLNRKQGMLVYTLDNQTFWQLGASLTNSDWIIINIGGTSLPTPTSIGQILYSADSTNLSFTVHTPMINDDGFISISNDGYIVVLGS